MNPIELILNPQTRRLRAGWRMAIFITLLLSPYLIFGSLLQGGEAGAAFDVSLEMILSYVLLVAWVVAVSWLCLRFLESMKISALGFALHNGWFRDVIKGCAIAASMIIAVVMAEVIGGGLRLSLNPVWYGERGIDWAGVRMVAVETAATLVLLILAGAFEELIYRGYAFQTLLRGAPAIVPILLLSVFFGIAHWENPSRTLFSTVNTALAGVWLSIAYLRTRSLWFPTALHFTWNWVMGAFFGIPVSGLRIPQHPLLVSSSGEPIWLTGGSYGSEGGVAATVALIIAIVLIWRAPWLRVSPEMNAALSEQAPNRETAIRLGLRSGYRGED